MVDSDFLQRFSLSMLHGVWLTIFFKRDFTFGEHLTCRVKYLIFLLPIWLVVFLVNSSPLVLAVSVGTLLYVWKELQELAREEKVKCVVLGISLMLAYALDSEYLACIAVFCALTQLLRWPISLKKTLREFRIVFGPVYTIFIVGSCIQANFTSNLLKVAAILAFLASILLRPDNNETLKIFTSKVPSQPCRKMTHGFFMFLSFLLCLRYIVGGTIPMLRVVKLIAFVNIVMYICVADFPRVLIAFVIIVMYICVVDFPKKILSKLLRQ